MTPEIGVRLGPPCAHGATTVCPHCDPRGFAFAYLATVNIIERLRMSDHGLRSIVDDVLGGP